MASEKGSGSEDEPLVPDEIDDQFYKELLSKIPEVSTRTIYATYTDIQLELTKSSSYVLVSLSMAFSRNPPNFKLYMRILTDILKIKLKIFY